MERAALLAADSELNIRLFAAGSLASTAAADRLGSPPAPDLGALNAIVESWRDPNGVFAAAVGEARVALQVSGETAWLTASAARLREVARGIAAIAPPLGNELDRAIQLFTVAQACRRPVVVMGIVNVTPDSFSDGGLLLDPTDAIARGLEMIEQGAGVIDVGGESTRPGAMEVPAETELQRVLPVVRGLRERTKARISVDTRKAAVARACLEAGADWINDVSALTFEPEMARVVAGFPAASLVLMHSRARPRAERFSTEYASCQEPIYEDVVADTLRWLRRQVRVALDAGILPERLWIDPGFGFGKTFTQNIELLRRLREYTSVGLPVLIGTSRKSSVGRLLGDLPPDERLEGTAATVAWAVTQGAAAVRVHEVREMACVVRVAEALR